MFKLLLTWFTIIGLTLSAQSGQMSLMGAGKGTPTAGGGGGLTWTFGDGVDNNSGVFTGITLGSGLLVVSVVSRSSPVADISAVSFGATSLTKATGQYGASNIVNPFAVWYGVVSAATNTITVLNAGGVVYDCAISYGVIAGANSTPTSIQPLAELVTTTPNLTITVPTGGIAITAFASDRPVTGSWSGSTQDSLVGLIGTQDLTQGHSTATGSINPKWTGTNAWYAGGSVAWGP